MYTDLLYGCLGYRICFFFFVNCNVNLRVPMNELRRKDLLFLEEKGF